MPFEPIKAPNLAEAAASHIRSLIASDVLRPGDQLPGERELAARMGISRTSLRAALRTLAAEGILVSRQGAGLWVSPDLGRSIADPLVTLIGSSAKAVSDYLHFRVMMEADCAATVAAQATAEERARIDTLARAMRAANEAGDAEAGMAIDTEFHMAIVEATGNVVTIQVARALHDLLQRSVRENNAAAWRNPADVAVLAEQHDRINAAIQTARPKAARDAMRAHLEHFARLVAQAADADRRARLVAQRKAWSAERGN